jgi:UDP-GlcNAc3NAcA epimerase
MSDIFFQELSIVEPDHNINVHTLSHGAMTGRMLEKIEQVLMKERPDIVLVYGDTNSTLAGAVAAVKLNIPVAHVEAGLRSFNRCMPEEINRVVSDHLSTLLLCPTVQAVRNLGMEGIVGGMSTCAQGSIQHGSVEARFRPSGSDGQPQKVSLVGDVMLDAALFYRQYARKADCDLPDKFVLATVHRAENTEDQRRFSSILEGITRISHEISVVLPLHPRTRKKVENFDLLNTPESRDLMIIPPVGYLEMLDLLDRCSLVMTDSGGLQKEAFFFKKPCVTLRDETEWVELVECGANVLAGSASDKIYENFKRILNSDLDFSVSLYGDGNASKYVIRELINEFV